MAGFVIMMILDVALG